MGSEVCITPCSGFHVQHGQHVLGSHISFIRVRIYSRVDAHVEKPSKHKILPPLRMPRLNYENRNRILGLLQGGVSQTEVARRFNVHRSTVFRLIRRFNATGSVADRPRPGARRVTTARQDVFIRQRHLRNRFLNAQSTASIVVGTRGRTIHRRTVANRLRERGILCRRPYKGIVLRRQHRLARLQWANNHHGNTNWRRVVFSDESRFNLFHADGRFRVYRRRNERFADNCVLEHDRFGGGGVMVWAAINFNFKSQLIICNGNLNAERYIQQVLQPVVLPMFQRRQRLIFMQDNAPAHRARATTTFLNNNNIPVLPWPSRSPDCNPIEHLWDELGRRLRRRQNQPNNVRDLANALIDEWRRIPRRVYRNLCESMDSRLRAVIAANGGHNRY